MTAPFHPLLLCLVRELVEADEAKETTRIHQRQVLGDPRQYYAIHWKERLPREAVYDAASEALIAHLLLMPCPQIDTTAYERLWTESLALPEDERGNWRLWGAVEDVARQAIKLYRGMK